MSTFRKTDAVVTREIAGETMLVPIHGSIADMERIFALDGVSAFIWERVDGSRGIDEISKAVTGQFDVTEDTAARDTKEFLNELLTAGLIEETSEGGCKQPPS